jgi:protein-tyrosine phosphatase
MNASWITKRIVLGGEITRADMPVLAKHGITHVLNCRSSYGEAKDLETAEMYTGSRITYLHVPTEDDGETKQDAWFHEGMGFMHHALRGRKTKCVVHCFAGINRSASMLYAFLRTQGYQPAEAERIIRVARPIVELRYQHDAERAFLRWRNV